MDHSKHSNFLQFLKCQKLVWDRKNTPTNVCLFVYTYMTTTIDLFKIRMQGTRYDTVSEWGRRLGASRHQIKCAFSTFITGNKTFVTWLHKKNWVDSLYLGSERFIKKSFKNIKHAKKEQCFLITFRRKKLHFRDKNIFFYLLQKDLQIFK